MKPNMLFFLLFLKGQTYRLAEDLSCSVFSSQTGSEYYPHICHYQT